RTDPEKPRTRRLPTSPSARRQARSRPARRAAPIASANTTSSSGLKKTSAARRNLRAEPPFGRSQQRRSRPWSARAEQGEASSAPTEMKKLVLLRHGESTWNKENRFTGWTDVDLTERGRDEAQHAGRLLRDGGYVFDIAYTSVLKRAIRTLWIALDVMDLMWIPEEKSWRLNERHYGALQGLNKAETAAKHGEAQTKIWRRSYDIPPPPLTPDDPRHPSRDPRYAGLARGELPLTESLK